MPKTKLFQHFFPADYFTIRIQLTKPAVLNNCSLTKLVARTKPTSLWSISDQDIFCNTSKHQYCCTTDASAHKYPAVHKIFD